MSKLFSRRAQAVTLAAGSALALALLVGNERAMVFGDFGGGFGGFRGGGFGGFRGGGSRLGACNLVVGRRGRVRLWAQGTRVGRWRN